MASLQAREAKGKLHSSNVKQQEVSRNKCYFLSSYSDQCFQLEKKLSTAEAAFDTLGIQASNSGNNTALSEAKEEIKALKEEVAYLRKKLLSNQQHRASKEQPSTAEKPQVAETPSKPIAPTPAAPQTPQENETKRAPQSTWTTPITAPALSWGVDDPFPVPSRKTQPISDELPLRRRLPLANLANIGNTEPEPVSRYTNLTSQEILKILVLSFSEGLERRAVCQAKESGVCERFRGGCGCVQLVFH